MNWTADNLVKLAAVAAAAFGVYYVARHGVKGAAAAATGVVTDAAAGVVIGAGKAVGIPETDETECAKAMREGRTWDASFACPAGTFVKYVAGLSGIDREIERQANAAAATLPPWVVPVGIGAVALWVLGRKGPRHA